MGNQVATASNFEDLFSRIVTFLTTNAALVAASEEWEVMRVRRDNLLNMTTNLPDPQAILRTARYDSRSLNTDNPDLAGFYGAFTPGVGQVTYQLRAAREVTTLRLRVSGNTADMPKDFRVQRSSNGTSWTTVQTFTDTPPASAGARIDFDLGTPGAYVWWRVIWDAAQDNGEQISWSELLLLQVDGTVANQFGSEVIFKAPGAAGADEIYTGIRGEYNAAAGWYNLMLNGYVGYDANEPSWHLQPGALPGYGAPFPKAVPMVPCWNTNMPCWLVASGRSFRFSVKVSTSFEGGYLGFLLPYCTPAQYPYPLVVGGSLVPNDTDRSDAWRYSSASALHGVFPGPGSSTWPTLATEANWTSCYLRNPAGQWIWLGNRNTPGGNAESIYGLNRDGTGARAGVWPHTMNDQWTSGKLPYRECLGGGYIIQPCVLAQAAPTRDVFGALEGVYSISGFSNAAENTGTYNGNTHVVFQNAYRNTVHEFWALDLT